MKKNAIVVVIIFNIITLIVLLESYFHILGKFFDNFVLDNYNHYLTCEQLPSRDNVEKVLLENTNLVQDLYVAGAHSIGTGDSEMSCEKTADIVIFYNGHKDRVRIEEILVDHTFKGIPVRLKNV